MAENEDFPVQRHEMSGLGGEFGRRLGDELEAFAKDADTADRAIWVLEGIQAAQVELERLRSMYVADARVAGKSWAEIGEALGGMTKQAVQQRYGK